MDQYLKDLDFEAKLKDGEGASFFHKKLMGPAFLPLGLFLLKRLDWGAHKSLISWLRRVSSGRTSEAADGLLLFLLLFAFVVLGLKAYTPRPKLIQS